MFYPTFFCQHDLFEWQLQYVGDMKFAFICQGCVKMCLKASFTSGTLQELFNWVRKCAMLRVYRTNEIQVNPDL